MKRIVALAFVLLLGLAASSEAASFKEWRNAMKEADVARAKHDLQKARRILEKFAPEAEAHGPESFAENSELLALVLINQGEPGRAVQVVTEALERMGNAGRSSFVGWKLLLYARRATANLHLGNYESALKDAQAPLRGNRRGNHPGLAYFYWIIGEIATAQKDYPKAEKAYRDGLEMAQIKLERGVHVPGRFIPDPMGNSPVPASGTLLNTTGLGEVCMLQKREKEAEAFFNQALKFAGDHYGKSHEAVVVPLAGRAGLYYTMKRRAEFEEDTRRVMAIAERGPGIRPQHIAPLWLKLRWDLEEGNRESAEAIAEKIASIFVIQNYGTKIMAAAALKVASLSEKDERARVTQVQELIRKAAAKKFADSPAALGPLLAEFALDAERARELSVARYYYDEILKMHEGVGDPGIYAATAEKIADILLAQHKPAEALPYLQKVTVKIREKYGDDSRVGFAMEREATVLKQLGRADEAKEMEKKALAAHAKAMLKR